MRPFLSRFAKILPSGPQDEGTIEYDPDLELNVLLVGSKREAVMQITPEMTRTMTKTFASGERQDEDADAAARAEAVSATKSVTAVRGESADRDYSN